MTQDTLRTARQWLLEAGERYRSGDLPGAIEAATRAADLEPQNPVLRLQAGGALLEAGRPDEAVAAAIQALDSGGDDDARQLFVQAARRAGPSPQARPVVARALREGWAPPEVLGGVAVTHLRAAWPNSAGAIVSDELLAELLVSASIRDPEMERRLTAIRKGVLAARGDHLAPFAARLALQCHLNEFAWSVEPDEAAVVEALAAGVTAGTASAADLLALASYRSIDTVPGYEALLDRDWSPEVRRVLDQQVIAPRAARRAAETVASLTPIQAGVSEAVRAQYEENPYPRWVRLTSQPPMTIDRLLGALLPHVEIAPIPHAAAPEMLIAGCGTGQEAILAARRHPTARVLAVDLSRASLGYAIAKTAEAGLDNVTYAQADILALAGRSFDVISSAGVLHHMADPFAGARVLAGLLRPGGVMKLGLYSAPARAVLAPGKALAKGYPATAEGIRALRAAILRAPRGDPVRDLQGVGDFYTLSTCRDLLMHVQEHEMRIADLRRILDETGLRFLGFSRDAGDQAVYREAFPDDPAGINLDHWAEFEARHPATFINMYQFWMQKPLSTLPG